MNTFSKKHLQHGPGLTIGIPTLGRPVPLQWALAFKSLNPPINYNTNFVILPGMEVGVARNEIAKRAIEHDSKYLFFLGDDVEIPNHTLRTMIYRMEQDEKIGVIGGVYCAKADPAYPLVFRENGRGSYWDWKVGEFFPCTGLGMDCTLIRVSLLKELAEKGGDLFKTVKSDKFLDGINSAEEWTEDLFFLGRVAKETDFQIFCDGGIICKHWDVYGGKSYTLPNDSLPMRQLVVDGDLPKLLDIGGTLSSHVGFNRVTFGPADGMDYRGQIGTLPFDQESYEAVNLPANFLLNIDGIKEIFKESIRVLKKDGIFKVTHTNALNQVWLKEVLIDLGCKVTLEKTSLIEAVKN